jgi:Cu-Zn family superoxide dismutase
MTMHKLTLLAAGAALAWNTVAQADAIKIEMHGIDEKGVGESLGSIAAKDTENGLALTPELTGLPPGVHGFHVHEFAACDSKEKDGKAVAGLAAGNHYDPMNTGKHLGPEGAGHLGDMPMLTVDANGNARQAVNAPRLRSLDLRGRALVVHAEPDNYADKPGGARIACGVVQ